MSTLERFFGNADKKAEVVNAMHITRLYSWFEACKWKMSAAQLSESQQVSIICHNLQGPIVVTYAHYACVADFADAMADAWEDTAGCAQAICLHENLLK